MIALPAVARAGEPQRDIVHTCDALELLRALPDGSVDAVITDPPYGLGGRVFVVDSKQYTAINELWDYEAPTEWMRLITRVLSPGASVICFGVRQSIYKVANTADDLGWRIVNDITWFKPDAMPNMTGRMLTESTERALWFCPDGTGWRYNLNEAKSMNLGQNLRDVWTFGQTREDRVHPAQKPLALIERMVRLFTNPGDLILDPFMGSGTTAVAAQKLGRHYIGADISPEYVRVARERLAQPFMRPLFDSAAGE